MFGAAFNESLQFEDSYDGDDGDVQNQTSSAGGKHYQWMLQDTWQWLNISHDDVIETHYCQPGAKGISLFTSDYGRVFLDFDTMKVQDTQLGLSRHVSLSGGDTEEYLWYYLDNRRWYEYGAQGTSSSKSSVTSPDVEQQYTLNPNGSCPFIVGNASYCIDFTAMMQKNLATGIQRRVRRRPKFNSVIKRSVTGPLHTSVVTSPPAGVWKWEFQGVDGVWTEYGLKNIQGVAGSVNSDDIERNYQLSPQGKMQFKAGRFSYTLDFVTMVQTNSTTGTKRSVKRVQRNAQQILRVPSLSSLFISVPPSTGSYSWEFRGDEGVWTEYKSQQCSVSSDDIERIFQQNPQGQVQFTAGRFSYTLDFSGMYQINNKIRTKRDLRRICKGNAATSGLNTLHTASNAQCSWQFKDLDGTWKEYVESASTGGCSVSSDDIERHYQQNASGTLNFRTGSFTYTLDFSAMRQKNLQTSKTRPVRRLQQ